MSGENPKEKILLNYLIILRISWKQNMENKHKMTENPLKENESKINQILTAVMIIKGNVYKGEFRSYLKHGKGICFYKDGRRKEVTNF